MAEETIDDHKNIAMQLIEFLDESSDEETRDEKFIHREIANYKMATDFLSSKRSKPNAIKKAPLNLDSLTDAELAAIWCPTPEDAKIGVHKYHEDNWRPQMEPYKPSIDVLYTNEKRLPLYYENDNYPSLEGLPYFRALQRHTNTLDSTPTEFIYDLPKKPNMLVNKSRPTRIPPGFERYAPKYFNKMEQCASGDNYPKGTSLIETNTSDLLELNVAKARKALKETYFDKLEKLKAEAEMLETVVEKEQQQQQQHQQQQKEDVKGDKKNELMSI